MAEEIERLLRLPRTLEMGIIGMESHPDGFITWGQDVGEAQSRIIQYWNKALR
ncbi:MAG: hypothetical protein HY831_01100 [Candidatus Aenigmarchaeota archaeon]|nr:hypothetical protein [Candidatus Aenigmarchaeota archaeon]